MKYNIILGNIINDRKLTFTNSGYIDYLHISLEHNLFRSVGKTIWTENCSIIFATNFESLIGVALLVDVKNFLSLCVFGLT